MSESKVKEQAAKKAPPTIESCLEQISTLTNELAISNMRVSDYRGKFEREHAAHAKTSGYLLQTKVTYDLLKSLLAGIEFDELTRCYMLGEEAQDTIDQGRKACGVK